MGQRALSEASFKAIKLLKFQSIWQGKGVLGSIALAIDSKHDSNNMLENLSNDCSEDRNRNSGTNYQ